jgi:hypothetical protein
VRTEEARARRRRSRKSETHLFKRTYQRIEVTIKENFRRKWNLSDQLNNNNNNNNKILLSSEGNQQFRGRGRGADAPTEQQSKTPRTQDNATRTGESVHAHVNRGTR